MEAAMVVIRATEGSRVMYYFELQSPITSPALTSRQLPKARVDIFHSNIRRLHEHISMFESELHGARGRSPFSDYRRSVDEWLEDTARMLRDEFLPERNTPFGQAMLALEDASAKG